MDELFETLSQRLPHGFGHIPWPPRRPNCLSVGRIVEGAKGGWVGDEVDHLRDCPHCQRFVAEEWLVNPPSSHAVARYMADCSDVPDAMELYLSSEDATVGRRLLKSSLVRALAELYRLAALTAEKLDGLASEAGDLASAMWLSTRLVTTRRKVLDDEQATTREIELRLAKLAHKSIVLTVQPNIGCEATINDGALRVQVSPLTGDALEVFVKGGMEWSESRVVIEAIGNIGEPFQAQSVLTDDEDGESASAKVIVPTGREQDTITLVVAAID